jgi:hypothetical protein
MNKMVAASRTVGKIDRSSYRRNARPFGYGVFPPATIATPTLSPSQLQARIAEELVRLRELKARQDALIASLRDGRLAANRRRAAWEATVDAIYDGIDY